MFCRNCGNQLPDNTKFCGKCGAAVSQAPARGGVCPFVPKGRLRHDFSFSPKVWAAGGAAVLLIIVIGVCIGVNGRPSRTDQTSGAVGDSAADRDFDSKNNAAASDRKEQEHDMTTLDVSSAIVLEGQYNNLKSLTMSPGADGYVAAITYSGNASFPVLESLECGAVLKISDSGDKEYLEENDFPQLKNVTMKVKNRYIDEDIMMTYRIFLDMYNMGRLQSFRMENSYTIEDLYGAWSDERQTLTLTFEKDGTLRVADAGNLIGVDVLKYKEVNENVLSLSADRSGLLGMVNITMKYELFGDMLLVEIMEQNFILSRK